MVDEITTKEFKKLQDKNKKIRDEPQPICDYLKLDETRIDLWKLINGLVENEIQQEELCN